MPLFIHLESQWFTLKKTPFVSMTVQIGDYLIKNAQPCRASLKAINLKVLLTRSINKLAMQFRLCWQMYLPNPFYSFISEPRSQILPNISMRILTLESKAIMPNSTFAERDLRVKFALPRYAHLLSNIINFA